MKALVLTGRILPGHDESQVWAEAAPLFKLDPEAFSKRVLSRLPFAIKESNDDAELQRLSMALQGIGANVETVESDGKWFLQQAARISGPVPLAYLRNEHQAARLGGDVKVKQMTEKGWTTLAAALDEPVLTFDDPPMLEDAAGDDEPPPLPSHKTSRAAAPAKAMSVARVTRSKRTPLMAGLLIAGVIAFVGFRAFTQPRQDSSNGTTISTQPVPNGAVNSAVHLEMSESQIKATCHSDDSDKTKVLACIRKFAEQGIAAAQGALGLAYMLGVGVEKDQSQGVDWLTKAAAQGNANAKFVLEHLDQMKQVYQSQSGSGQSQSGSGQSPVEVQLQSSPICYGHTCIDGSDRPVIIGTSDEVVIEEVVFNRGNCKGEQKPEILRQKYPFSLRFGQQVTLYNDCRKIIELTVMTDRGSWTFNPK